MNLTNHAIMRFLQRNPNNATLITQHTYKSWCDQNKELLSEATEEMKREFEGAKFICEAKFEKKDKARFYVNLEALSTFVVDMSGANVITYYQIDFGLDEIANAEFLKALLGNRERLAKKFAEYEEDIKPRLEELEKQNQQYNSDIEVLESQIKALRSKKETISAQKREYQSQMDSNQYQLDNVNEKLIRSARVIV